MNIGWITYGKTWDDFEADGLLKAGVQIDVGAKQFLIGDINCLGGVCGDCPEVVDYDTIDRYRVLVDLENLK